MKYIFTALLVLISFWGFAQNPSLKVIDTDFSKGRLVHQQIINLTDVTKFHGHLCDGLAVGFVGMSELLFKLFSDSIIDRTNIRVVSKSSPCLTDIAIYLTGSRYQYNTFYVSDSIKYAYIVQRIDNGKVFGVKLKPTIKPAIIDSLGAIANTGKLLPCDIDKLQQLENDFQRTILTSKPTDLFMVEEISKFSWNPLFNNTFLKTDIVNKNLPTCTGVNLNQKKR